MNRGCLFAVVLGVAGAWWFLLVAGAVADDAAEDEARRQRLELLQNKLDELTLALEAAPGEPLIRREDPVLRFGNPTRQVFTDGAVFLWLSGGRPVAAASLWIRADGAMGREFTSLADGPLVCAREGAAVWTPQSASLPRRLLPDAPQPSDSVALRLVQMRREAARFSGAFYPGMSETGEQIRVMPQPLERYAAETEGVLDGAIFAMAQANDPEALLILELAQAKSDADPAWRFALARMSSMRMRIRLDDREIWSAEHYWSNPRTPRDPYQERYEKPPEATESR